MENGLSASSNDLYKKKFGIIKKQLFFPSEYEYIFNNYFKNGNKQDTGLLNFIVDTNGYKTQNHNPVKSFINLPCGESFDSFLEENADDGKKLKAWLLNNSKAYLFLLRIPFNQIFNFSYELEKIAKNYPKKIHLAGFKGSYVKNALIPIQYFDVDENFKITL